MPISPIINHLLAQEPHARERLRAHAGKVACIDLSIQRIRLRVAPDAFLEAVGDDVAADVTITIKPTDLPLIAMQRERMFSYVRIDGDAEFANTISALSKELRWEAEEDLSKLFGDVAAVRLVSGARWLMKTVAESGNRLQENVAEYLLEENPTLMRPAPVETFGGEVNRLRDDVERLQKRIEKLERSR